MARDDIRKDENLTKYCNYRHRVDRVQLGGNDGRNRAQGGDL